MTLPQVKREEKRKQDCPLLREVIIRTMAWGFSSSGVERQFARGNWLKGHREVTVPLANDELRATEFVDNPEELLELFLSVFSLGPRK